MSFPLEVVIDGEALSTSVERVEYSWEEGPSLVLRLSGGFASRVIAATIWQNRYYNDVVKVRAGGGTARFLAAFFLFDQFKLVFVDVEGRVVKEVLFPAPRGCLYAESALPEFIWRFGLAARAYGFRRAAEMLREFAAERGLWVNWRRLRQVQKIFRSLRRGV